MSKIKVRVETKIPVSGGPDIVNNFEVEIENNEQSQEVVLEYESSNDGGPLMRPKNPPR